jgi:hypothetical protein
MLCHIASEYVSKLKIAGHPTIVSNNQIASGRVVLTVEPSLEQGKCFQIQVPHPFDVKENLCLPLLFSLILESTEVWWPLWLRISTSISGTGSFTEIVNNWEVTASLLGQDLLLRFSVMPVS